MMAYNPYTLEGKTVLVTGASSGIGQSVAIECSKMGAKLILTSRNESRLKATFDKLDGEGHVMIQADLTLQSDIDRLADEISPIDGLVNNAGIGMMRMVGFIKEEDLESMFKTNTFSSILVNRALLKKKKLKKGCSIVFTSSIASMYNTPGNAIYAATKSALTTYMRTCALELADKQIRANTVHPGMTETPFIHNDAFSEDDLKKNLESYPLKRYGKPEDIAYAIIYLLSDAASWVTGTSLVVDGGRLLK